jgi:hypothetical protein
MFALIRPAAQARCIDGGRVQCPLRERDVEVDLCAGCEWMTEFDLEADPPFVRCRPGPMPVGLMRIWT